MVEKIIAATRLSLLLYSIKSINPITGPDQIDLFTHQFFYDRQDLYPAALHLRLLIVLPHPLLVPGKFYAPSEVPLWKSFQK